MWAMVLRPPRLPSSGTKQGSGRVALTTGHQLKAGRALAGWTQAELADAAAVNVNTVRKMEACGPSVLASGLGTIRKIERAMRHVGVEFVARPDDSLGLTLHRAPARPANRGGADDARDRHPRIEEASPLVGAPHPTNGDGTTLHTGGNGARPAMDGYNT